MSVDESNQLKCPQLTNILQVEQPFFEFSFALVISLSVYITIKEQIELGKTIHKRVHTGG